MNNIIPLPQYALVLFDKTIKEQLGKNYDIVTTMLSYTNESKSEIVATVLVTNLTVLEDNTIDYKIGVKLVGVLNLNNNSFSMSHVENDFVTGESYQHKVSEELILFLGKTVRYCEKVKDGEVVEEVKK